MGTVRALLAVVLFLASASHAVIARPTALHPDAEAALAGDVATASVQHSLPAGAFSRYFRILIEDLSSKDSGGEADELAASSTTETLTSPDEARWPRADDRDATVLESSTGQMPGELLRDIRLRHAGDGQIEGFIAADNMDVTPSVLSSFSVASEYVVNKLYIDLQTMLGLTSDSTDAAAVQLGSASSAGLKLFADTRPNDVEGGPDDAALTTEAAQDPVNEHLLKDKRLPFGISPRGRDGLYTGAYDDTDDAAAVTPPDLQYLELFVDQRDSLASSEKPSDTVEDFWFEDEPVDADGRSWGHMTNRLLIEDDSWDLDMELAEAPASAPADDEDDDLFGNSDDVGDGPASAPADDELFD